MTIQPQKKIKAILLSLFLILSLSSCTTKIVYNYLDWGMQWELNSYVDLSKNQKKQSRALFNEFHNWHRETQLPLYSNYLRAIHARLSEGAITAEELELEQKKIQSLLNKSIDQLLPGSTQTVSSLTDKQVEEIQKKLAKDRKEYRKKYLKPNKEKRRLIRVKEARKQMKPWLGKPSKTQKQLIENWSHKVLPYEQLTSEQQEIWAEELKQLLIERKNKDKLQAGLKRLFSYQVEDWQAKAQKTISHNQKLFYQLTAELLNSASESQKAKMFDRLSQFAEDFDELANETK